MYAMYPQTTSLYTATVIDNTTYCREDDDIIVVEFDGDEADETGSIPRCHIPARFVTLIPKEFPGAQPQPKNKPTKSSNSKASASTAAADNLAADGALDVLGDIPFDDMAGLDNFDELDFDLGFN